MHKRTIQKRNTLWCLQEWYSQKREEMSLWAFYGIEEFENINPIKQQHRLEAIKDQYDTENRYATKTSRGVKQHVWAQEIEEIAEN